MSDPDRIAAAMFGSAVMMAHQVAGKAARDALFLSTFDVTALPSMVVGASLFAIVLVVVASRVMGAVGPARFLPMGFGTSAALHGLEYLLVDRFTAVVAVVFYLHFAALNAVLISAFWSLLNESFDPHSAKRRMSQVVGAGALGAVAGGLLAERVAAIWAGFSILPGLVVMHLLAGSAAAMLRPRAGIASGAGGAAAGIAAGTRLLARLPYLRHLALLVFVGTAGAGMLDYVFKARVQVASTSPEALQRFWAVFYTAVSLLGFVLQAAATRRVLEKAGLGAAVGALPAALTVGSLGAWIFPGLGGAAAARAGEYVVRNSLFRSGYELLYTPVLPGEKRLAKPLIDVGLERMGDLLGGAAVRCLLWLAPGAATAPMLAGAAGTGLLGIWLARRLDSGYTGVLEKSLRARALELDLESVEDKTTQTALLRAVPASGPVEPPPATPSSDPLMRRIQDLHSGEAARVRQALREGPLTRTLAAYAIPLLARDDLTADAAAALRAIVPSIAGQLIDALLDPSQEFAVRRRIPGVLAGVASSRVVEGLALGLEDKRFEVRFRCARALAAVLQADPALSVSEAVVFAGVSRELAAGKLIWQSHRLLDGDNGAEPELRVNCGMEHVFNLFALVLPAEPVRIAFRALHTGDRMLRGTALEYLESVLPREIHTRLVPFLDDEQPPTHPARSRDEILSELQRSHQSVELKLAELRAKKSPQGL